jgi:uncharacterized protein YlxP (DUF503 family)
MNKHRHIDKPVAVYGKVVFEFYNNEDEEFKERTMRSLAKEIRKELNVSCVVIEEHMVENPERGALAIAVCGAGIDQVKETLNKVTAYLDEKAPARIISDEFEEADIL